MRELLNLAGAYGLSVHAVHMEPGYLGYYAHEERRIYFNIRCTPAESRSVVAHELGHAHYGHTDDSPANEDKADAFAAMLLIDPDEYAQLEKISDDVEWLADEFHVTVDVIECFRRLCLQRVGRAVYVRPRMGRGQWAARLDHV